MRERVRALVKRGAFVIALGGEVVALELGAAQDRLRLRRPDGGETLVPFVEAIVPEVDPQAGRLVVDAPPGLLDLDAAGE